MTDADTIADLRKRIERLEDEAGIMRTSTEPWFREALCMSCTMPVMTHHEVCLCGWIQ